MCERRRIFWCVGKFPKQTAEKNQRKMHSYTKKKFLNNYKLTITYRERERLEKYIISFINAFLCIYPKIKFTHRRLQILTYLRTKFERDVSPLSGGRKYLPHYYFTARRFVLRWIKNLQPQTGGFFFLREPIESNWELRNRWPSLLENGGSIVFREIRVGIYRLRR